jgi:tetratricopeptide (TPR) repeat protein
VLFAASSTLWSGLRRHWAALLLPPAVFLLAAGVTRQVLRARQGLDTARWEASYQAAGVAGIAGDRDAALAALLDAAAHAPDDAGAHIRLAEGFEHLDQKERALDHVEQAIRLREVEKPAPWLGLVRAHADAGRLDDAGRILHQEVMPRWPDAAEAHYYEGVLISLGVTGDEGLQRALESFERALELDADAIDARYQRGVLLARLGRLEEAEAALRAVVASSPRFGGAYHELVGVLRRRGELEEARRFLETFQRLDAQGRRLRHLETQVSLQQADAAVFLEMGELYLELDEPSSAVQTLRRYTRQESADPGGHRALARAYRSLDMIEDAESEEELAAALE